MHLGLSMSLGSAALNTGAGVFPLDSRLAIAGDSIPTQALVRQQVITQSLGRYYLPLGFGKSVAGWTAAQTAADVANVTALSPDVVWLHVGTNDLAGTADTPATIFGNIETCVNAYLAVGARVIVDCVMPRGAPNALTSEREADRLTLNTLIRGLASYQVVVLDLEDEFDPATDSYDGLHPNGIGGVILGGAVARQLNRWSLGGSILPLYLDDSNLIKTAGRHEFAGTAGSKGTGFTGEVGTGWGASSNGTDLTIECFKTTLNGAPAQGMTISGTSGANSRNIILSSGVPYSGSAGQSYEAWAEFEIEAGSQNCYGVFGISDTAQLQAPNNTQDPVIPSDVYSGVARHAITSQLAGTDTSNNVSFSVQFAAGEVSATVRWAKPLLRLAD